MSSALVQESAQLAPAKFLVRLKRRALKRRKGIPQTPDRYMIQGVRFEEKKGWYIVRDKAFADVLRDLTHNDREDGIPIFDVCTPAEAEAIQAREKRVAERRDVDDAQVIGRAARPRALREQAVKTDEIKPNPEPSPVVMIDGADDENEDLSGEGDEAELEDVDLGRLDGATQEVDDGDDLLDPGGRAPRAPRVVIDTPAESPAPRTRARGAAAKEATPAPKKAAAKGKAAEK